MPEISQDNINVHSLWIGKHLSSLELLTLKSFIKAGHKFHLWIYEEIETPLPPEVIIKDASEIISKENIFKYNKKSSFGHGKGSYAGFSDIFRYKLLYDHGGWWVDMDVCCLKPLNIEVPYVFRKHHYLNVVGNIMKCPAKSKVMLSCYKEAIETITEDNKDWHKPIIILNQHINSNNLQSFVVSISNEDRWLKIRKYLFKNEPIPIDWYAIHWVNVEWTRNKIDKNISIENSVYHKLLVKNGINISLIKGFKKIKYLFKISWLWAVIRQLF